MNLEYLENYLGLVRFMNFTKAAESLHISQSTLSKQVSMLEYSLKTVLIVRNNRTISLTNAGKYLAEQGEKLLKMNRNIEHNLTLISNQGDGPLIISMTSDGSRMIYNAMCEFQTSFPQIDLIIKRDVMRDVVHAVLDGTADFGITPDYVFESFAFPVVCRKLALEEKPFYVLVPEDDPLADRESIWLEELPAGSAVTIADGIVNHVERLSPEAVGKLSHLKVLPSQGNQLLDWEDMVVQVRLHRYYIISPIPNQCNGCARLRIRDEYFSHYTLLLLWRSDNRNQHLGHFSEIMEQELAKSKQ